MSSIDTKTKYTKYPLVDSLAKGVIIDGFTTATLLPPIIFFSSLSKGIGYAGYTTLISIPTIIGISAINSFFGSTAFFLRSGARENGYTYEGALTAGAFKYNGKELVPSFLSLSDPMKLAEQTTISLETYKNFQNKIALTTVVGAINAASYEICNDYKQICSNDFKKAMVFSVIVETAESLILNGLTLSNAVIGILAGAVGSTYAYKIYGPNIEAFHSAYDYIEDNFLSFPKEKFAEFNKDVVTPALNNTLNYGAVAIDAAINNTLKLTTYIGELYNNSTAGGEL